MTETASSLDYVYQDLIDAGVIDASDVTDNGKKRDDVITSVSGGTLRR